MDLARFADRIAQFAGRDFTIDRNRNRGLELLIFQDQMPKAGKLPIQIGDYLADGPAMRDDLFPSSGQLAHQCGYENGCHNMVSPGLILAPSERD